MQDKLFQIARFNLLAAALTEGPGSRISDAMVYAWDREIYPIYHSSELADSFEDEFAVDKDNFNDLLKYLDEKWDLGRGKPLSFYQMEDDWGVRRGGCFWDRYKLIHCLRYIYLSDQSFDSKFFNNFIADAGAPSEANYFMTKFDRHSDIFFS